MVRKKRSLGKCTGYCSSCPYQYPECGWDGGIDFRTLKHNQNIQHSRGDKQ